MTEEKNLKEDTSEDTEQPLVAHLIELRQRLLYSVGFVLILFLAMFPFSNKIYALFIVPIISVLPEGNQLLATGTIAPFLTPFKLTFYLALYVAVPFFLFQLWAFIAPGLYKNEKRFAFPLLVSSVLLFYTGILFAYFLVLPALFHFMAAIELPGVAYMPDITENLNIVLKLFFAFGLAFEVPIATVLLIRSGITTSESLTAKRPYIFIGCFFIGMLLTPPDVISQVALAFPMWLLFEAGIMVGRLVTPESETETA